MPPTIGYDDAPLGRFHYRVAIASTGGVFSDGFGLGIIGTALASAAPQLTVTSTWLGLLGGASLAGLFIGALVTGPLADQFGRRRIYAYNMALLALLSAAQFLADSNAVLLALRLAIGFVLGTDYVVSKALLSEFTPRRYRGVVMSSLSVAWAGGFACAYAVGVALSGSGADAWRFMLLASAAPCLVILPLRLTMPESPLWLVDHDRAAQAALVVRSKLGAAVRVPERGLRDARGTARWRQLFSPAWRRRTLVGCSFFTCQVIPYFAVGTFVSQVLAALHSSGGHAGGLIYNAALLLGAIIGLALSDSVPRRTFLIGSFSAAAAAMLLLILLHDLPPLAMFLLFGLFAVPLSAASNLVYVYLPELFPTDLRASGIALAIAASRIGSAIGTFLLPVL
ncbi:MAG TPA: MFS transporter, partial [Steroidobacteraceae bacterium]|nr:MFS transporter [Steroidobacteraceae bacterium]